MQTPAGVIVADDLTGAADACAMFVARGASGIVMFEPAPARGASASASASGAGAEAAGPAPHGAEWLAISTETRPMSAARAADRVRDVLRQVRQAYAPAHAFKKIDSTLRGHVGAEIVAAMEAWDARVAIVAPAFPAMGRTVEGGLLRVSGPGAPPPCDVTATLEAQGVRSCRRVARPGDLSGVRDRSGVSGVSGLSGVRDLSADPDARVLVCDAASDADLDAIVTAGAALDGPILWVGSAGLADALARRLAVGRARDLAREPVGEAVSVSHGAQFGAVVFWIGSNHPVTIEQRQYLLHGPAADTIEAAGADDLDRVSARLDRGDHLFVDIGPAVPADTLDRLVHAVVERPVGGFVLSGGDTAAGLCGLLDATCIRLGGEVRRGIPWGWLFTRSGRHWPVVLKSGGFGDAQALHDTLAFLSSQSDRASRGDRHA